MLDILSRGRRKLRVIMCDVAGGGGRGGCGCSCVTCRLNPPNTDVLSRLAKAHEALPARHN